MALETLGRNEPLPQRPIPDAIENRSINELNYFFTNLMQPFETIQRFNLTLQRSVNLLRWVGYGFLILSLFDLIAILSPLNLMNPVWEFQTMGQLVERVAVSLLGFCLVFFGEDQDRRGWEFPLLRFLSWVTLLAAIIYLLLIPVGVSSTMRLNQQNQQQIDQQTERLQTQFQTLKQQLETIDRPEELEALIRRINGQAPEIQGNEQFNAAMQQLERFAASGEEQIDARSEAARVQQRQDLLKRSLKWNLGALVIATLFIGLFKGSIWAR
ncbi:MAG: HpsJ family protein [Microcoleaceae cyanobacterium]